MDVTYLKFPTSAFYTKLIICEMDFLYLNNPAMKLMVLNTGED